MKTSLFILWLALTGPLVAQGLESVELKPSDLVAGEAENDLAALAQTARVLQRPVVVMAPDSWRQQIAGLLRKAWPQIRLQLKKSPSGKMRAYILEPPQVEAGRAPAPEVQLGGRPPVADFSVAPVQRTEIRAVNTLEQPKLIGPGLVPLGRPGADARQRPATVSTDQATGASQADKRTAVASEPEKPSSARVEPVTSPGPVDVSTTDAQVAGEQTGKPDGETKTDGQAGTPAAAADPVQAERRKLEKIYNRGRAVNKTIPVRKLRRNDVLYVWEHNVLVMRKSSASKLHYWLLDRENLQLDQPAIRNEGNHLYRIIGRLRH